MNCDTDSPPRASGAQVWPRSGSSLRACADRLPAPDREAFLRLLQHAMASIHEGVGLRRAAWRLYRDRILERAGELNAAGLSETEIAGRIGMTRAALRRMLDRAVRDKYGVEPRGRT